MNNIPECVQDKHHESVFSGWWFDMHMVEIVRKNGTSDDCQRFYRIISERNIEIDSSREFVEAQKRPCETGNAVKHQGRTHGLFN